MEYLALYDKAKSALSEAYTVDELSAIIDQSDIIKYAAKVANDSEMVQMATEIKLRAERRFGEVSRKMDKAKNQYDLCSSTPLTSTKEKVLQSVGVSRQMAHQYEKLADIPEERFEKAITEFKKEGELSRAKLFSSVKAAEPKPPVQQITIDITPPKHQTQIFLEVILNDIKYMTSIEEVRDYIINRINFYKNGQNN